MDIGFTHRNWTAITQLEEIAIVLADISTGTRV